MTKVALVTGASSGIGEAIAIRLASHGIKTYGAARHTERMKLFEEVGGHPLRIDMEEPASIEACVAAITAESGGVDILINVAGTALYEASAGRMWIPPGPATSIRLLGQRTQTVSMGPRRSLWL
jgi:NADP-dependent 3-hydroxy acid dehydrogenase YdfG